MLYTIGDSHSHFTFHDIPEVKSFWLGPWTMYRIGRDSVKFKEHGVPVNSTLLTCFGEIDARCHVQPQAIKRNISIDEVIYELVTNYINALMINAADYKIAVMSVVPPAYLKTVANNPDFPFIGNDIERSEITKKMNTILEEHCKNNDILFFNIYNLYADTNGMLPSEFSDWCDGFGNHIKVTNLVRSELIKNDLIK